MADDDGAVVARVREATVPRIDSDHPLTALVVS
jgi:hypothetical protein